MWKAGKQLMKRSATPSKHQPAKITHTRVGATGCSENEKFSYAEGKKNIDVSSVI